MQKETYAGSALTELLRAAGGSVQERIDRALAVLADELGMEIAFVGEFRAGQRVVTHAFEPGGRALPVGTSHPVEETLCRLVAAGELPVLIPDVGEHPVVAGHPHTVAFGLGSYAGVPLRVAGQVLGTVCSASTEPARAWSPRDEATLQAVATYIGELVTNDREPPGQADLRRLAAAVAMGDDLEALTRPLLQLLQEITGLDSTYLTLIDEESDELVLAYACNVGGLTMPEGLTVNWQDSPCRRAMDEGSRYVADVAAAWPDSAMGRDLGITTFVSVPIRDAHDELMGTLCGAGRSAIEIDDRDLNVMQTFAQLLAAHLAREAVHHQQSARAAALERRLSGLREAAERDPLTGLANRTGIRRWLSAALEGLHQEDAQLTVAFIDLDRFKVINDTFGHATGDEILREVASSLAHTGRQGDLHGRLGGDEFVVAALLPPAASVDDWYARVCRAAVGQAGTVRAVGSVGVVCRTEPGPTVDELLHDADQAMYRVKQAGRA